MGQVIFCYFLQKKVISQKMKIENVTRIFKNKFIEFNNQNLNYYNNFLEYLFYEV